MEKIMVNDDFEGQGLNDDGSANNGGNQAPLPPKSNAGKYIGIGCLVIVLIFIALGYGSYRALMGYMEDTVAEYTESESRELPKPMAPESASGHTLDMFDDFVYALKNDEAAEPLVLDAEQINQIISYHPDFAAVADKININIKDSLLFAEVSAPLDMLKEMSEVFEGRYLNGSLELDVELKNGRFEVYIESVEVKGEQVPEGIMQQVRTENFAKEFNKKQENKDLVEKLESIKIDGDIIEIVPKNVIFQ